MTDNTVASETRVFPSKAAADRAYLAHRAELIAELGWAPEGNTAGDKYLASNVELTRWINEKRAAGGREARVEVSFTNVFNMQKVKALTVYRFNARGELLPDPVPALVSGLERQQRAVARWLEQDAE